MSIFFYSPKSPSPLPKKDLRSLPTRELLIWGDTDKVEVRKKGELVYTICHIRKKKISVASITFHGHIIWFAPPPCKKNKRKDIVCIRTIGEEREREREIFNWLVVDYFGDTDLNIKFPKAACHCNIWPSVQWLLDKHHKKNALFTYIHMAIMPKSKLLAHHGSALY